MIKDKIYSIIEEIRETLSMVNEDQVAMLVQEILKARIIITAGAGRVGIACRGFAMRLSHLGLRSYHLGDATVPHIDNRDLLIIGSGSGETQTIFDIAQIAKQNRTCIALITNNLYSRIGNLADCIVEIHPIFQVKAIEFTSMQPIRMKAVKESTSVQPMTTLNEQSLTIFYDAIVLELMARMKETTESMKLRHSNLE